jgi:hypothetical protein
MSLPQPPTENAKRALQRLANCSGSYSYWSGRKTEESMVNYICVRCGVQYAATMRPPARCDICEDEREAVYWKGQRWTTLTDLRRDHHNVITCSNQI